MGAASGNVMGGFIMEEKQVMRLSLLSGVSLLTDDRKAIHYVSLYVCQFKHQRGQSRPWVE